MSRSLLPCPRRISEKPRRAWNASVRVAVKPVRGRFAPALRGRIRFVVVLATFLLGGPTMADDDPPLPTRIATLNASLYGKAAGEVAGRLAGGDDPQATDHRMVWIEVAGW